MNIGEQVIERPEGTRFIKSVYQDNNGLYVVVDGKRQRLEDRGKVVDHRGKKVFEFSERGVGRPREYEGRERTSLMLSTELIKLVDEKRSTESRSVFIERKLREILL